jgi:hypothetical protein
MPALVGQVENRKELPSGSGGVPATLEEKKETDMRNTAPEPKKTRSQIAAQLAESQRAEETLPSLIAKANAKGLHLHELEEWEERGGWKVRREEALTHARGIVEKIRQAETELQRHMSATVESPMWRSAKQLVIIAGLREQLRESTLAALQADYQRQIAMLGEDDGPQSLLAAKAKAAEVASPSAHKALVESLDPGWTPTRALPEGPQRDIAVIIWRLLFPSNFEKTPIDSSRG